MKLKCLTTALCGILSSSLVASTATFYVSQNGTNPVPPYSDWTTAATNIQDAIDASTNGDQVLVTNGVYAYGGRSMDGVITNRVALNKAILVQSVNGPVSTIIQGAWDPASTNGPAAIRCAWLTNNAILSGFTIRGGATLGLGEAIITQLSQLEGGGVLGASINSIISNCIVITNYAGIAGGGVYSATANNCTLACNYAIGSGITASGVANEGQGGGAAYCNLTRCLVISNYSVQLDGGGIYNCNATNCALIRNKSGLNGSGASGGTLVNCTVVNNLSKISYTGSGGAVAGSTLLNCIVYGNFKVGPGPANYDSSAFSFSDSDPLPTGAGNIDVDPEIISDNIHLASTSPCIGVGNTSVVSDADIDGQSWLTPPAIGCDEWHSAPSISLQPSLQINSPPHGITFNVIVAGQPPFTYFWSKDGVRLSDDGHHSNSTFSNLIVSYTVPSDGGNYQVMASNAFGLTTSQITQIGIHAVDATGGNPTPPFSSWPTAATNIQDAINIASGGDIVLVTNGVYASGGKVVNSDLTNRVALTAPLTLMSVNGYSKTFIQGAWDQTSTNGPGAVRCAYVADGASIIGFTLQGGATRSTNVGQSITSGGGAYCTSTNGILSNCVLTNNSALNGGGITLGTLNNSLVICNFAVSGGGAYFATLNNCTVVYNYSTKNFLSGGGTSHANVRNSIVLSNYDISPSAANEDNFGAPNGGLSYAYSCSDPRIFLPASNISTNVEWLDLFHIASTSPCVGAGSSLYASGTDLDGETWGSPPSMGCDEVIASNIFGPLALSFSIDPQNNLHPNEAAGFTGYLSGRSSRVEWNFGDGPIVTNQGMSTSHTWTSPGNFNVSFTAYNADNPAGITTNAVVQVLPLNPPQLQSIAMLSNGFQFEFMSQTNATYTVQYATNLFPTPSWKTLQSFLSLGGLKQINDPTKTNAARFYRVLVQ